MMSIMKKYLMSAVLMAAMVCAAAGCGQKGPMDAFNSVTGSSGGGRPGFEIPAEAALSDFDWAFHSAGYDSGKEEPFSNPMAAAGVWEMTVWRKPSKKSGAQKEVYWVNIILEGKNGKILGLEGDETDPALAADVYANQAFKNSNEAKNSGLSGSDAAGKLIAAIAEGDGSVKAHVTVLLAGVEDDQGNWRSYSGNPVQLEGKYYPEMMYLKAEDSKGNEIGVNQFLTAGDEQHATGAFTPAKNDVGLYGAVFLFRR